MTNILSATTWGSPTATKHALLLHGLTGTSHTWHRVASSLAAQGYLVTAPNLIGHASRVATDYRMSSIAEDVRPYLAAKDYSLIIGHSLGAVTALALLSHISPSHPTAIVLIDPPMRLKEEQIQVIDTVFSDACVNIRPVDVIKAEHPLWTREDCIYWELAMHLCPAETVHLTFQHNMPWNFYDHLGTISDKWKVTVLLADPTIFKLCAVEDFQPFPHVRPVVVPGAGHSIQAEFPEVVVDEALKTVAGLESA